MWYPGGIGQRLRRIAYSPFFGELGHTVKIDIGCIFDNPANIFIGNNVWIMPRCHLTARPLNIQSLVDLNRPIYVRDSSDNRGSIIIGNEVSIGEGNIIQGYGGVSIGDRCTTSARVSIYSMSHAVRNRNKQGERSFANSMVTSSSNIPCVANEIVLHEGVWIGLNAIVFGGVLGEYAFIKANSVIMNEVSENSITDGLKESSRYE
jgi:acetyltransferase-like isoleucine patch superfamily enzyme